MQKFYLLRDDDISGISGTGIVAEGVILNSGKVILEWIKEPSSINIFNSIEDLEDVHGHNGATKIVFE